MESFAIPPTVDVSSINVEVLHSTEQLVGLIEQIQSLKDDLVELEQTAPLKIKAELTQLAAKVEAIIKVIDGQDDNLLLELLKKQEGVGKVGRSSIDRLGIGEQIIKMRYNKKTYDEIATHFGLALPTVARYCKVYDSLTPTEQLKKRSRSIMDVVSHWEDMGALIYRMLGKLENDPRNHVMYLAELRQLLASVDKFQSRFTAEQEIRAVTELIKDILIQELPEKQAAIMNRFNSVGVGKMLKGGGKV